MRKIILLLTLLPLLTLNAQVISDTDIQTLERIKENNLSVQSVSSDFRQIKHMSILGEDMVSDGKLYYVKPDKMAMLYNQPEGDMMIINGDKMIMAMGGRVNETSAKSNAKMRGIKNILTSSLEGDVRQIPAEEITCSETDNHFVVTVNLVKGKANRSGVERIVASYDKKDYTLSVLRMDEKDGTYTNYELLNKKLNHDIEDDIFLSPKK